MRKNIVVILAVGSSVLALSTLWAQDAKFAADSSRDSRSFAEALAEAKRLGETEEGKAYDDEFGKAAGPRLSDAVSECTKNLGPRVNFEVVFVFAADGHVEQVLTPSDKPAAQCFGDKLRDLQLPPPPHAGWPLQFTINISPENAPRILASNLKLMEGGTWEVDATISRAFKFRVHGLLSGKDFDLTVEPEDRNAFRQIAINDQVWASFDGSKTWKLEDAKGHALAQRFYAFVHNPLRTEATVPALEVVKQETRDGETWMQLRPKVSDQKKVDPIEYWIAISQDPKRNGVRRYEGPVTEPGHENEPLHCVATYQPANDKTIQPPANTDALSQQDSTPSASPDANFATDNLKYSRDFYSKVHFVAIANLDFGAAGTAQFKYDRYPNGGPERIQTGDGEFARKDGKTWLKSNDWGETGKQVDAQTAKRLNNWVGLINARLNGEPASKDPSEGATVMKFIGKEDQGEREEFVFEESKEKPKAESYPHISFGRFKNAQDQQVLLSEFSGPMQLGARGAKVKISFSHLIAVQIKDETNAAESPPPAAVNGSSPDTSGQSAAAGQAASSAAPVSDESDGHLVNRGIEKGKKGDLDGAIADFDRAIKLNPKDDAPYYNRAQAKRLKKDAAGAIADYTRAIELGSTNPAAYNNRGNARAENNDQDGAIADYTRAIELKPDYARAYYNRAVAKKEKGDASGAAADFKHAQELDPELVSEESVADSGGNGGSANTGATGTTVSLLDRKLKLDIPPDFSRDPDDPKNPKTIARFSGPDGAWGEVLRGTHGLTPDKLQSYLKTRVGEYSKGFKWLPKDSHLQWLKKEIVTIDGRKWADWRFVPILKGKKDYSHNPVYTRFLTTSYEGQLLEVTFTSNLNTSPELKAEINRIMDSVHLEE
jgi:tetratricopeptide (TPR) repeat protein